MPFKSEAQRRWMYANKPEMAKKWEKHTPKGKKLPEKVKGGADESQHTCKYCKQKMKRFGPERGKGYTFNPDQKESAVGAYSCTNQECPHKKEKGYPWSVPIMNEHVVSHDVEVVLNGEKYLLEAGDRIIIEND